MDCMGELTWESLGASLAFALGGLPRRFGVGASAAGITGRQGSVSGAPDEVRGWGSPWKATLKLT